MSTCDQQLRRQLGIADPGELGNPGVPAELVQTLQVKCHLAAGVGLHSRRLRQARKRLGISQLELGVRIGLDPGVASTRLNRYEQAVHLPDYFALERLAEALGVPLAYLFANEDELADLILEYKAASEAS